MCVCVTLRVGSTQCSIAWLCYIGNVYSSTESRSATWHILLGGYVTPRELGGRISSKCGGKETARRVCVCGGAQCVAYIGCSAVMFLCTVVLSGARHTLLNNRVYSFITSHNVWVQITIHVHPLILTSSHPHITS